MGIVKTVNVKGLDHSEKEKRIFPGIEGLSTGDAIRLVVEFNPLPLVKMMEARRDLAVAYEKEGPDEWIVKFQRVSDPVDPAGELKEVLALMRAGAPAPATKARAARLFQTVDAKTIAGIEGELVEGGLPRKEIRENLCDIHLEVLRGALVSNLKQVPKLHPVHTLMEEHVFILASLRELAALVERLDGRASFQEMGGDIDALKGIAHHLVDAESHHEREEAVLYPRMEAHGAREPAGMMREDHVEFRARKRRLYQLAQAAGEGDFAVFAREVTEIGTYLSRALTDHIFKEDTIVYQLALEVLTPEEWDEVKRGCDAIGYCCFTPGDQADQADAAATPLDTVALDLREVSAMKRLETILKAWKSIEPGQALRITNDKEPKPLQVLFRTRERGKYEWHYETEGPTEWVAKITKLAKS